MNCYKITLYLAMLLQIATLQAIANTPKSAYVGSPDVVAACLVLEAGGEGKLGMEAVLCVLRNRSEVSGLSMSAEALKRWQFSCFNGLEPRLAISKARRQSTWVLSKKLVSFIDKIPDVTGGATHYYAPKLVAKPKWAVHYIKTIGNHKFYREAPYRR